MKSLLFFTGFFVVAILLASCGSSGSSGSSGPVTLKLSVAAGTGNETADITFSLTLNKDPIDAVSFRYRIKAGTAEPADFASTVQLDTEIGRTFAIGERTLDIVIEIKNDELVEPDETFSLILSDITGATFDPAGYILTAIGTIASDYADIDGNGLIEIDTPAEMNNVRYNLAGTSYKTSETGMDNSVGCPADTGCVGYELVDNIDLASFTNWTPIWGGYSTSITTSSGCFNNSGFWEGTKCILPADSFNAIFDGKDNTISNLTVSSSTGVAGLFGVVFGTLKNLNLRGGSITGEGNTGALTGYLASGGIIENTSSDLAVNDISSGSSSAGGLVGYSRGGSILNSYATSAVTGGAGKNRVGGLVGVNDSSSAVQNSYAIGVVKGGAGIDFVGGLAGSNDGTIQDSYATGAVEGGADNDIVGGLVGYNYETVLNSYALANVDGGDGDSDYVGRVAGRVRGTSSDIFGNYALSSSTLTGEIKRTIGTNEVVGKDASGLKALTVAITETDFTSTDTTDGWSTNNWKFKATKYPSLKSFKTNARDAQVEGDLLCTQGVDWNLGDEWVQC